MKVANFIKDKFPIIISIASIISVLLIIYSISLNNSNSDKFTTITDNWEYLTNDSCSQTKGKIDWNQLRSSSHWKAIKAIDSHDLNEILLQIQPKSGKLSMWYRIKVIDLIKDFETPCIYLENVFAQSMELYFDNTKVYERQRIWFPDTNTVFLPIASNRNTEYIYISLETPEDISRIGINKRVFIGNSKPLC